VTSSLSRTHRRPLLLASAALLAVTLVGCSSESDDDAGASASEPTSTAPGAETAELPEWAPEIQTEGDTVTGLDFGDTPEPGAELEVATVKEGDGPTVEVGRSITVSYWGSLYQSKEPFDENYSTGRAATFPIGVGRVIPGWDQGIPGLKVGSRIIMSIPADLAYGAEGRPPVIPGNSPLYFVVDIISVADGT
jgi:peptidylprolyl isomerase